MGSRVNRALLIGACYGLCVVGLVMTTENIIYLIASEPGVLQARHLGLAIGSFFVTLAAANIHSRVK
jgi:hypothetical protein